MTLDFILKNGWLSFVQSLLQFLPGTQKFCTFYVKFIPKHAISVAITNGIFSTSMSFRCLPRGRPQLHVC